MSKYLSLSTTANNIGEEIQIIAAQRYLPQIDGYVGKERINTYTFEEVHKIIINGWFMRNYKSFHTITNKIQPLIISLHITPSISKGFFTRKNVDFLKKNSPIGCRDTYTLELMKSNNIPAYFSGCLTLTLQRNEHLPKKDYVLLIDCPDFVEHHIKKITERPIVKLHPMLNYFNTFEERMMIAKLYLKKIQQSHIVISSRLHGVLPALALETPAVFINREKWNTTSERCSSYQNLLPFMSQEEFVKNINDLDNIKLYNKHISIRDELIGRCSAFTGFNNCESLIPSTTDDQDVELLFSMMNKNNAINKQKVLYDVPVKYLVNNLYTRVLLRKNDDDIY